ncbi:uncharacterized protein [Physcomitrium patens]|uniref:uncharacterized protein isoform X4 n=1 Tax=Physcomitrium patens TaxID=3218 RepID=UPI003CCDB819
MAMIVKPMRPPPAAAIDVRNLEVACVATVQQRVRCATYTGKNLFTSDHKGVLYVWSTGDATNIKFHDGVGVPINVLRGTNDRRDVWLGFSDGNIAIMSVENKSIGTRWKGHPGGVSCIVAMTHSVWSGGVDFQIRKWSLSGEVLMAYGHHHTSIRWLCMVRKELDDTEMQMWSSSNEPEVAQCSLLDHKSHHDILGDVKKGVGHKLAILVLCQVGKSTVWSGSEDNLIKVWSVLDVSLRRTLSGHAGPVCSLVQMGPHVWSGSADCTILVWDASSHALLFSLGHQGGYVKTMVKVDWQLWVFASGKNIKIWAAASLWGDSTVELEKLKQRMARILEEKSASENALLKLKEDYKLYKREAMKELQFMHNKYKLDTTSKDNEIQKMKEELIQDFSNATSSKTKLEAEKVNLRQENNNMQKTINAFERDIELLQESNKCTQKEKDRIIDDLNISLKDALHELTLSQESISSIQSKLDFTLNGAKIDIALLKNKLEEQERENNILTANLVKLKVHNDKVQLQLETVNNTSKRAFAKINEQARKYAQSLLVLIKQFQEVKHVVNKELQLFKEQSENSCSWIMKNMNGVQNKNKELLQKIDKLKKSKKDSQTILSKDTKSELENAIGIKDPKLRNLNEKFQTHAEFTEKKINELKAEMKALEKAKLDESNAYKQKLIQQQQDQQDESAPLPPLPRLPPPPPPPPLAFLTGGGGGDEGIVHGMKEQEVEGEQEDCTTPLEYQLLQQQQLQDEEELCGSSSIAAAAAAAAAAFAPPSSSSSSSSSLSSSPRPPTSCSTTTSPLQMVTSNPLEHHNDLNHTPAAYDASE